jgi:hypothetical protein
MLKKLAHDVINDITLFQTNHGFHVRYGLESTNYDSIHKAMTAFFDCQVHALRAEGHL